MRRFWPALCLLAAGCSSGGYVSPIAPAPYGLLWGFVAKSSGACIEGAKVEVIAGQAIGEVALQKTPCNVWAESDGFLIQPLTLNVAITVRASAPGYQSVELTRMPQSSSGYMGFSVVLSELK